MHKKLGPLEAWQWAAILAGLTLVYYEYEKSKASSTTTPTTSSVDTSGPIDPTTGLPYADEIGTGGGISGGGGWTGSGSGYTSGGTGMGDTSAGASTDSGTSLQQELSDLGSIESLMAGLGYNSAAAPTDSSATGDSGNAAAVSPSASMGSAGSQQRTLTSLRKTVKNDSTMISKLQKQVKKLTAPKRTTKPANHKNPGHTVTHVGGARIVSSSAPHNARQHNNVAPPSHQRATHRPAPKPKPKPKPKHKKARA